MDEDFEGFLARAKECREAVLEMKNPILINHYDCDGLSAGAVVCKFLEENGIAYRVNTVRKLDDALIEKLREEREIIFADLGGGHSGINELLGEVVIFDHHQTQGIEKLQLNPHLFGLDGGTEMSGSTCAYWGLEKLPEVAIVGAVGDMQYPLVGANRELAMKMQKAGRVKVEIGLKMYGRMSRPLPQFLAYSDEPFLPGLGGDEARCAKFLENLGIGSKKNKWGTYEQLGEEEKKSLVGALASHLAESYGGKYESHNLVGEIYSFPRFENMPQMYDAGEFSTMLNACGRHNEEQVGLDVCLMREGALKRGEELLAMHKKSLREGVEFAYRNTRDFGPILVLDGRGVIDDGIIGVVAGMLYGGQRKKPILGLSFDDKKNIKVSARGTKELLKKGLNLGMALHEACKEVGGRGGGHHIAAGATVPPQKLDEFLRVFVGVVNRQITEGRN